MNYIDYLKIIDLNSFGSSIAGAGIGAWLAFEFNQRQEKNKAKEANLNYLLYSLTIIAGAMNSLYSYKKDYIAPEKIQHEINYLSNVINEGRNAIKTGQVFHKELTQTFEHISMRLTDVGIEFPVDIEKLNFISKYNPNIICLLNTYKRTINNLNLIHKQLDEHLANKKTNYVKAPLSDFELWYSHLVNINNLTDKSIDFSHMLINSLIKVGIIEYGNGFSIKSIKILDDYKSLSPKEVEGWDSIRNWNFENKTFIAKHMHKIISSLKRNLTANIVFRE